MKKQCNWERCQIRSVSRVRRGDISRGIVTLTKIPIEEEDQDKIEEEDIWLRLLLSCKEERLNGSLMDNFTSGLGHCFWLPVSAGDTPLGVKHIFKFQKFSC